MTCGSGVDTGVCRMRTGTIGSMAGVGENGIGVDVATTFNKTGLLVLAVIFA